MRKGRNAAVSSLLSDNDRPSSFRCNQKLVGCELGSVGGRIHVCAAPHVHNSNPAGTGFSSLGRGYSLAADFTACFYFYPENLILFPLGSHAHVCLRLCGLHTQVCDAEER